jgi:hypothetical protein
MMAAPRRRPGPTAEGPSNVARNGGEVVAQPLLGVVSTTLVVALSFAWLSLFDFPTFVGWVAFVMLCLVPAQVITVVLAPNPPFAPARQPARGLVLLLGTLVTGAIVVPIVLFTVGEGVTPPGPIPSHYAVVVVPTTFFLAIAFNGWPFTRLSRSGGAVTAMTLPAAYLLTYAGFRLFFDYAFLDGTPADLASAPAGIYHAVTALVFYVTALAGMFLVLHFDLWPLTTVPAVGTQPALGLLWLAFSAVAAAGVMQVTGAMDKDPMWVLTRVTAPFIFGTIVVLNMLQNSLFARLRQPLKGLCNSVAAMVVGVALAQAFGSFSDWYFDELPMGGPGYEYELWLVNALLSVTFPFLIVHAAYFGYWPLARDAAAQRSEPAGV